MQEQEKKKSTFAMGEPHGLKKEPPLKGKLMQAILMYVQGKTKTAISKELDVSLTTIFKWFECPNVQEEISKQQDLLTKEFRDQVKHESKKLYKRSLGVMSEQLDSDNDWIRQNAARDLLTRFQSQVLGEEANEVTVRVIGMPEIGESTGKDDE